MGVGGVCGFFLVAGQPLLLALYRVSRCVPLWSVCQGKRVLWALIMVIFIGANVVEAPHVNYKHVHYLSFATTSIVLSVSER